MSQSYLEEIEAAREVLEPVAFQAVKASPEELERLLDQASEALSSPRIRPSAWVEAKRRLMLARRRESGAPVCSVHGCAGEPHRVRMGVALIFLCLECKSRWRDIMRLGNPEVEE